MEVFPGSGVLRCRRVDQCRCQQWGWYNASGAAREVTWRAVGQLDRTVLGRQMLGERPALLCHAVAGSVWRRDEFYAWKVWAVAADVAGEDRPLHDRRVRADKEIGQHIVFRSLGSAVGEENFAG